MKNKHIGSNFDDFLKEEGMLEEIKEVVKKKLKNQKNNFYHRDRRAVVKKILVKPSLSD
jgi:hypothetical protein